MTPTESGTPTCPVYASEEKSREFVDFLLDDGEQTALLDAIAIDTDTDDIDDVTGWGCSVSLPRPPLNESRRTLGLRKKSVKQPQPDIDLSNMTIRCVNEDYAGDHQKSIWKANVEPGTYRYISNNGIYRSTKFASIGSDWVTAKRSRHIENNVTNPDVKQAQRTLKKDLDNHFKFVENTKNENGAPLNQVQQQETAVVETASLPPPSRPPKDPKLIKSASDLFVENFSTKISAFEKSLEKEGNPTSSAPRSPCSPHKNAPSSITQSTLKRHHDSHASDAAKLPGQQEDISKDVFTIRPVTRAPDQPLGPLEKLTPQQKLIDRASESECSSHQTKSQPESPSLSTSFMTAMTAFAQLHHSNHRPKDTQNRSNPSTYRKHYKSSSMSNVSDTDSLSSVRNALTLTNSNIERMRMGSYGKTPVKDYGRFLSTRPRPAPQSLPYRRMGGGTGGPGITGSNIHRKGIVGYKTISNSAPISHEPSLRPVHQAPANVPTVIPPTLNIDGISSAQTETPESYLSGTSLVVNRGSGSLRDGNNNNMALPEIAGKRLAVTTTTQRML